MDNPGTVLYRISPSETVVANVLIFLVAKVLKLAKGTPTVETTFPRFVFVNESIGIVTQNVLLWTLPLHVRVLSTVP